MENLTINVYGKNDEVVKTVEAKLIDIKFGTIRKLMSILDIDNAETSFDILNRVYGSWEDICEILTKVFPDLTEEEMDNVNLSELVPTLLKVIKFSFAKITGIPGNENEKNQTRGVIYHSPIVCL